MGRSAELVERDDIVAELSAHVVDAAAGRGRLVLLRGEAGIGKTSVVQAVIDRLDPQIRVLKGLCDPLSTPVPLGPIAELALDLGDETAARLATVIRGAQGLGSLPPAVFAALDATTPVVWVVEDMHWADEASIDVLCYIARRLSRLSALIIVTYRDVALGPSHPLTAFLGDVAGSEDVFRIDLPALSLAGVQALSDGCAGVDPAALHETTGGNAFLVRQALVAGSNDGTAYMLRESVLGRLARLKVEARAIADVVAVLGSDASRELVEVVSPNSSAGLDECISAGVLRDNRTTVEICHELVRRTLWETIPIHRRQSLHGAALTALALSRPGRDSLARMAFHADEACDVDALLLYAPAAAAEASALGDYRQAADCYSRLLGHGENAPIRRRAEWLEAHSHAAYICGSANPAVESIVAAARLREELGDELGRADDLCRLSQLLYLSAPLSDVRDAAERALALLVPLGPSTQLAWAYANRAQLAGIEYDRSGAARFGRKARQLALVLGDVAVGSWARLAQAFSDVAAAPGSWNGFDAAWQAAVATPGATEHTAMAGVFAGLVAVLRHDYGSAERYLTQTDQLCHDNNLIGFGLMARVLAAVAALDRGRPGEAEAVAAEILGQPTLSRLHRLWAQVIVATVKARSGCDGVWPLLDDALSSDGPDDPIRTGIVCAARIEAAWLADDAVRARAEAERALAWLPDSVDGWIAGRICAWAQIVGVPSSDARCSPSGPYALQLDGDWEAAADLWMQMGCPYNSAVARMHSGAPGASATAVALFESVGATAAAARARRGLSRRRRRLAVGSDPFGFTDRERQVADLLAMRYSDREIAAALFISPKTAGHHVSAIFSKLGVGSRAAARERLCDGRDTADMPG